MKDFAATIGKWASETKERIEATHKRSIELLAEEMIKTKANGGRLPHKTGNLMRSQLASTQAMPKTAAGPFTGSNVGLVVATMKVDQPIWIGYQSNYARRQNYGFVGADSLGRVYNQSGNHFIEAAIAKWPQLVAQAAKETEQNAKR